MNGILFANNPTLKVLIIVLLSATILVLNLTPGAEPLTGLDSNNAFISPGNDQPEKPRPQSSPKQADTVAKPQRAETTTTDDDHRCTVICLLPGVVSDKE